MLKSRATWKIREILFRTTLNLLGVPKCYVLLTQGPKCFGMQISKTNDFLLHVWCIFSVVSGILWKTYVSNKENACSQFPRTELVRNLIQIWDWSDEQNTIILQGLKEERVRKTQKIIVVKTKQWILVGGFLLRIEISGKGCVYHNLPWVFNLYVLRKGGGGES